MNQIKNCIEKFKNREELSLREETKLEVLRIKGLGGTTSRMKMSQILEKLLDT